MWEDMLIANLEEAISEQGAEQVRIPPLFYIHSTFIDAVFDLRSPCVRPVLGRFPRRFDVKFLCADRLYDR